MRRCLTLAQEAAAAGETPVGAVVVYQGREIAAAHNEREAACDVSAHAEILALRRAGALFGRWVLPPGCTLYVTLEPCPMCAGAIVQARPGLVVFGAFDPTQGGFGGRYALHLDPALGGGVQALGGVLRKECEAALTAFFRARRAETDSKRGDG